MKAGHGGGDNIRASLLTLYVLHMLCPLISSSLQPSKEGTVILVF